MSELKADKTFVFGEECEAYKKSEADKVIAEKDKEIARLDDLAHAHNIELLRKENVIAELKEKRDTAEKLLNKALDCVSNGKNHMMSLARKKNHADYKRCLAMANYCQAMLDQLPSFGTISEKENWWDKWSERWLAIAEKFKPNPTINIKGGTNALQR